MMRRAIRLARRATGCTSPNPLVGAVLSRNGEIIGEGWHQRAGQPHAEVNALADCQRRGFQARGATLHVTLEPCCTSGRTPPCTDAIRSAGIERVVVGTVDPNPAHAGHGIELLRAAGIAVSLGVCHSAAIALNPGFNHWIVHRTPFVTLKCAMTLDGKIATARGESKWITGPASRALVLKMRQQMDAVLVGVNTVIADNPGLLPATDSASPPTAARKLRVVLDSRARTPPSCGLATDEFRNRTVIVVGDQAPQRRIAALARKVTVLRAPMSSGKIDLGWLMQELGRMQVTSLLVEGGGEVHSSFLAGRLAHRVALFYAPKVLGGARSLRGVGGTGLDSAAGFPRLSGVRTRALEGDLLVTGDLRFPG